MNKYILTIFIFINVFLMLYSLYLYATDTVLTQQNAHQLLLLVAILLLQIIVSSIEKLVEKFNEAD